MKQLPDTHPVRVSQTWRRDDDTVTVTVVATPLIRYTVAGVSPGSLADGTARVAGFRWFMAHYEQVT